MIFLVLGGLQFGLLLVGVLLLLGKRTRIDLVMVTQLVTTLCVGLMLILAAALNRSSLIDVALVLALLAVITTLALGFVVAGLLIHRGWDILQLKLLLVYGLALGAAAINGYLIGQRCYLDQQRDPESE